MEDPYDLERFLIAQDSNRTYARCVEELRRGRKTSHWMWFVFPQIAGLGHSATSVRYAIRSLAEAIAYLRHPILGRRLVECAQLVNARTDRTAREIFGDIDARKLHSCMTLFHQAGPSEIVFEQVLDRCFGGEQDASTVLILRNGQRGQPGPEQGW